MELKTTYRTHTCNELTKGDSSQTVTLSGFVHTVRDHGDLIFLDLRDRYGLTQVVISKESPVFSTAQELKPEYVIRIEGVVKERSEKAKNPKITTGDIEVEPVNLDILSASESELPFQVSSDEDVNEQLRLRYRYLDLRRRKMQELMELRHEMVLFSRKFFAERGFIDFQTPILTGSTPEGARDFVIPSRVYPGKFYALPQSPQQYKQLLMIAGFDRYFQFAPCFRDEDPRADRLYGDFYQIDAEMSFVSKNDIYPLVNEYFTEVVKKFTSKELVNYPDSNNFFEQISFRHAMNIFGSDKPDIRYGLHIADITDIAHRTEARFLNQANCVKAIKVSKDEGSEKLTRQKLQQIEEYLKSLGAKGLGYMTISDSVSGEGRTASGSIAKFISTEDFNRLFSEEYSHVWLNKSTGQQELVGGDTVLVLADDSVESCNKFMDKLRRRLAEELELIDGGKIGFVWIEDFPFFELDDEGRLDIGHNPFSNPNCSPEQFRRLRQEDPLRIYAQQYDLACNGYEILSGGERNYNPEILSEVFQILGYGEEDIRSRFGHMLEAFKYGAPPTAGFAIGFDRFFMTMIDETNIRNVFPFPKDAKGFDPMFNCPNELMPEQFAELGVKVI
jgi:aspartyl-tRNA synthetase